MKYFWKALKAVWNKLSIPVELLKENQKNYFSFKNKVASKTFC